MTTNWPITEQSLPVKTLAMSLWNHPNKEIKRELLKDGGLFTFRMREIKNFENLVSNFPEEWNE